MKYYRILSNIIVTYEKKIVFHNEKCTYIFLKHSANKIRQKA